MNPVHITHYTITSAIGSGRASHLQALQHNRSGLREQTLTTPIFDDGALHCWLGEVSGLTTPLPPTLSAWECRNNRLAQLALQQDDFTAAVARLRTRIGATRIGVFIGTSTAGIYHSELAYRQHTDHTSALPDWFDYRHTQNIFSSADFVAHALQLQGHRLSISTACSSSAKVFAAATRAMQLGLCDAAVVGGVDSLCLTTLYGFNALQLISSDVCRPADIARNGISIGEAAGFALLERTTDSTAATSLLGYGESSDAHHMSTPDPNGRSAAAAMQAALAAAQLPANAVRYINLHGTGTPTNDAAEDQAVCSVFGPTTACSSTKGWTGHTLGAAGIVEAVLSLLCIETGLQPCSLNTQQLDPEIKAAIVLNTTSVSVSTVMSNSFGFGGSNCCLLLGACP